MDPRSALNRLGWHVVTSADLAPAVRAFQRGWHLGPPLVVDGKIGPKTTAALQTSLTQLQAGHGTASQHFSFSEFACKCGGKEPGCRRILLVWELVASLERYRTQLGRGVTIVSGYRCPRWNAKRGGAKESQHMYGAAADLDYELLDVEVMRLQAFAGIGRSRSSHKVRHVDRRDHSGHNPTGGTVKHPTIWDYAN